MWVRSQNRQFLGDVEQFIVYNPPYQTYVQILSSDESGVLLGSYTDVAEAVRVLDKIHTLLPTGFDLATITSEDYTASYTGYGVFEMPQRGEI